MTESDRCFMVEKCCAILHYILVEIRHLSWESGNEKQINDLADLAHNIPLFMTGQDDSLPQWIREALVQHSKRRWPTSDPEHTKFVELWDMDDDAFQDRHRQYSNNGLAAVAVAS